MSPLERKHHAASSFKLINADRARKGKPAPQQKKKKKVFIYNCVLHCLVMHDIYCTHTYIYKLHAKQQGMEGKKRYPLGHNWDRVRDRNKIYFKLQISICMKFITYSTYAIYEYIYDLIYRLHMRICIPQSS
jgi:hypothetical protein